MLGYIAARCLFFQTHSNTGHMTQTYGDTVHDLNKDDSGFIKNYFSHTWLCKGIIRPYDNNEYLHY